MSRDPTQEDYDYKLKKKAANKPEVPRFGEHNSENKNITTVATWDARILLFVIVFTSILTNVYIIYGYKNTDIKSQISDLTSEIKSFNEKNKNNPNEINNIKNNLIDLKKRLDEMQSRRDSCLDELEKLKLKTSK